MMTTLTFKLDEELKAKIEKTASESGLQMSSFMRVLVLGHFKQKDEQK